MGLQAYSAGSNSALFNGMFYAIVDGGATAQSLAESFAKNTEWGKVMPMIAGQTAPNLVVDQITNYKTTTALSPQRMLVNVGNEGGISFVYPGLASSETMLGLTFTKNSAQADAVFVEAIGLYLLVTMK